MPKDKVFQQMYQPTLTQAQRNVLFGNANAQQANLIFDADTGRINLRGGTTTQAYIDSDGSIVAGSGAVVIDSTGITITTGLNDYNQLKFQTENTSSAWLTGATSGGADGIYSYWNSLGVSDAHAVISVGIGANFANAVFIDIDHTTGIAISQAGTGIADLTVDGKFGCNGATAQAAYASGGALASYGAGANGFDTAGHASDLYAMVVAIRAALVANGIMS